jgi:hypothetical protein
MKVREQKGDRPLIIKPTCGRRPETGFLRHSSLQRPKPQKTRFL